MTNILLGLILIVLLVIARTVITLNRNVFKFCYLFDAWMADTNDKRKKLDNQW